MIIRRAHSEEFAAAARLLAENLGFTPADAIPAWFMRTTDECGGVTLVAVSANGVAGTSYAVPGRDADGAFLFSCGLAVAGDHRGRRLGLDLKRAQRREAMAQGYSRIRWTTDPANGRALRLYLSHLGARVVGYRAGLHDGLRSDPGHPQDDLDIVWYLDGPPWVRSDHTRAVELPWADAGLDERQRVRIEMSSLLADGYVGSGVEIDRDARRCRVVFTRPSP